jgi:peptidoglycan/LPS O-acetylase OafA/YrhL
VAVYGFFGISGYLIAGSMARNRPGRYLWQRFLRIFPGFWVCLIVTAFFFGIIEWLTHPIPHCGLSCYFDAGDSPVGYLYRNWLLPNPSLHQWTIAGTPRGVPYGVAWNGSMWTLCYEFLCYLMLLGLALAGYLRSRLVTLGLAIALWALIALITLNPSLDSQISVSHGPMVMYFLKFSAVFLGGTVMFLYQDRIPDSGWLALACVGVYVASLWLPNGFLPHGAERNPLYFFTASDLLTPLVAYPLLWLGIHLPFQRVASRNDYSYGVYIYAYPVSQLLASENAQRWGYPAYLALCIAATAPFALASWWLVEKRALSLKKVELKPVAAWVHRDGRRGEPQPTSDGTDQAGYSDAERATGYPPGSTQAVIPVPDTE